MLFTCFNKKVIAAVLSFIIISCATAPQKRYTLVNSADKAGLTNILDKNSIYKTEVTNLEILKKINVVTLDPNNPRRGLVSNNENLMADINFTKVDFSDSQFQEQLDICIFNASTENVDTAGAAIAGATVGTALGYAAAGAVAAPILLPIALLQVGLSAVGATSLDDALREDRKAILMFSCLAAKGYRAEPIEIFIG